MVLTILIVGLGVFFTFGVSGQQKKLDTAGMHETLNSLADASTQARELSAEFTKDRVTPNYYRIQMNSILRDLQISQSQLAAAEVDPPLASAKQEARELYGHDISTIEQLRDSLFDKHLAETDISIFEKVAAESKKVSEGLK